MIPGSEFIFQRHSELSSEQGKDVTNQVEDFGLWPECIVESSMNLKYWGRLFDEFPEYQFYLLDQGRVVGNGNCVPLHLTQLELENLPEQGWDWAIERAFLDKENSKEPNVLCALQIGIAESYQAKGYSKELILYMKSLVGLNSLSSFILPIRPNQKRHYPLVDINTYVTWVDKAGLPFDSWIRTHVKNGAQLIKVCHESTIVYGTVAQWEQWTNLSFQSSGSYVVPDLLNPIEVDLNSDTGVYKEPNIWIHYNM